MSEKHKFYRENTRLTTTPSHLFHTLSPFPSTVYTFKTSPCMPAPRAHVENTCARGAGIHEVFSVSHTTHTTHHTTTHHNNTTTTPHGDRQRERERQGELRRRKRRDKTRQDKREERTEKNRFQCGGAWPFLVDGVLFLVNPICARDLSLLNWVKYGSSLISFNASWPVNIF